MSQLRQRHVIGCRRAHGHTIPDCCLVECWCGGKELSHPETSIYLIGSLRNPKVPQLAAVLRAEGYDVFDDWYAAGPEADDYWQRYEQERGHTYARALRGYAAEHVWGYDKSHLNRCDIGVLMLPAGKSGHLELGYIIGLGKRGLILLDKTPDRWDVMYRFAEAVCFSEEELIRALAI